MNPLLNGQNIRKKGELFDWVILTSDFCIKTENHFVLDKVYIGGSFVTGISVFFLQILSERNKTEILKIKQICEVNRQWNQNILPNHTFKCNYLFFKWKLITHLRDNSTINLFSGKIFPLIFILMSFD